jgi:hypothetical protein
MKTPLAWMVMALMVAACGDRNRASRPLSTTQGSRLNVGTTALTPQVHINPQGDAGAVNMQIGNVRVQLPAEAQRGEQQAEREAQE